MQSPAPPPTSIHPSYPDNFSMSSRFYRGAASSPRRRSPRHRRVVGQSNRGAKASPDRPPPKKMHSKLHPWKTKNSHVLKKPVTHKPHQRPPPPPSPIRTKAAPIPDRSQAESTFNTVARWKKRLDLKKYHQSLHPSMRPPPKKKPFEGTTQLTNEMMLYLCDVSGPMIKGFRRADDDMSGELSKEEFEEMISYMNNRDAFNVSKQDADLLFLVFDDDNSGSITTREMVEGLFHAHTKCPTNILGQRLMPRRSRDNHDEKHQLSTPRPPRVGVFEPLLSPIKGQTPMEYERLQPREPKIFNGRSAFQRRYDFLYGNDDRAWVQEVRQHHEGEEWVHHSPVPSSGGISRRSSRQSRRGSRQNSRRSSRQSRQSRQSNVFPAVG